MVPPLHTSHTFNEKNGESAKLIANTPFKAALSLRQFPFILRRQSAMHFDRTFKSRDLGELGAFELRSEAVWNTRHVCVQAVINAENIIRPRGSVDCE